MSKIISYSPVQFFGSSIDTRKKYKNNIWKGAGFELFYTAFEESLKEGCGGRLRVFATTLDEETNPIKFYFSKGFRSCQPSTLNDNDIAKGNIPLKSRIFMYLPYERIKKLKENKPSCF